VVLAVGVLGGGLAVVLLRNVIHSAVAMMFCFGALAGIYALLGAPIVAAAQVLIYLGAISVLILFAIGYTAMSRHMATAGGFYVYIGEGLGLRAAFPDGPSAAPGVPQAVYVGLALALWGAFELVADDGMRVRILRPGRRLPPP